MASELKHLTEKTAKLSIDPIYDTNWSDMPDDIKLECIGKMEFKERLSLRCTAKAERSLVDSQKIEFSEGRLWGSNRYLGFNLNYKHDVTKHLKNKTEALKFMKYIKKVGVFENLSICFDDPLTDNEQFMTGDGLFTAKTIEFEQCDNGNVVTVLRKMQNGVESIKINADRNKNKLNEILAISHVQNVPYWHIEDYKRTDSLHKVAQMWIDTNSKIGSTFQVTVLGDGSFDEFLKYFTDRIISKSEKRVRIRSNNQDRHILLERGLDEVMKIFDIPQFFRMMVISAEIKESEYDDNCRKWIGKMDPYVYNRYEMEIVFEQDRYVHGYEPHYGHHGYDENGWEAYY
ncbi:hypothetical protein B9Z55_012801 [Caenorhabditis nigoni]|uniref:F-box domain-containing protein n=1 Tax=Caenorhabditis nigoni TaxID=1611254 RepID=A0A2G5TZG1_9PELO|nr:hypothetical protein B9Z55_012801 [Caenorhabditis nigoni]